MKPATYKKLLKDLQKLQKKLVTAYEDGVRADPARMAWVTERWKAAEVGGRVDDYLDVCARRSAVQLLLRTVYVRVLEDMGTLDPPRIRGQWGIAAFKEVAPSLGIRGYLRWVFRDLAKDFPALFTPGPDELPLPAEDLLREIWDLWHREDGKGGLVYDWQAVQGQPASFDSRFLGDLYQDLDREVRKRFALLQTPVFVEEYILDHTLTPALAEFDPAELRERGETFRLIDPTCGSGHFLIGAFHRLADWWRDEHGLDEWEAATRALESVWGADLNPHAVDIARFRLLLEVRARTGQSSLEKLASVTLNLAVMDSLVPWERLEGQLKLFPGADELETYGTREERRKNAEFLHKAFHAVVGNPPYITAKDPAKRDGYRDFWPEAIGGKYSLSAPFAYRFMTLPTAGGFSGQINGNAFLKRQFGRKVIEQAFVTVNITGVVDTSGAYIPGHGTPTVILFAKHEPPDDERIWCVLGKRGESGRPEPASSGVVWSAIQDAPADEDDSSPYVSVVLLGREVLAKHPWSLAGGAAPEIQQVIEAVDHQLGSFVLPGWKNKKPKLGNLTLLMQDEVYFAPPTSCVRDRSCPMVDLVEGEYVRQFAVMQPRRALYPYAPDRRPLDLPPDSASFRYFTRYRHLLWNRRSRATRFRPLHTIPGAVFYEYPFYAPQTLSGLCISFAFVATHNHFSLSRGGKLFKQSAPVVKLPKEATEDDYLDLLGALGSSTLGFWMKQVFHCKGASSGEAIRSEDWEPFWEYDSTKLKKAPLATDDRQSRIALARALDKLAQERTTFLPCSVFGSGWTPKTLASALAESHSRYQQHTHLMVALQEELDWLTYQSYGLLEDVDVVSPDKIEPLSPGHRPFEILAARADEDAPVEEKSAWWDRHGHPKVTEIPDHYSAAHRARIQVRMDLIEDDDKLQLLESFPFKRRWQLPDLNKETTKAAEGWLLDRLEDLFAEGGALAAPRPYRLEEIVVAWTRDPRVAAAAAVYEGTSDVDLTLVAEKLLAAESLPDNPRRLYATSGLRKLDQWKEVWALQDREDAGEDVGTIEKPPEFVADDFLRAEFYSVRGKLNVPRERFIAFQDLSPPRYGWNGWRDLDRGLAQVEAFTEAESDAYNPLPPPTHDDPRRCGVTLGLWESLDDVRRWSGAEHHIELQALASEACRQEACPCEVVKRWQQWTDGKIEVTTGADDEVLEVTLEDRAFLAQLLVQYGVAGVTAKELVRAAGWSAQRLQLVLDDLVATGSVGKSGRGARTMYALPESALPQQKLF
jgi:hypothetical protein